MIRLVLALLLLAAPAFADSSIDTTLPVQGVPYNAAPIRQNFQAAANDINSLQRLNAGASAPASPVEGQLWLDTSATPSVLRMWSPPAASWVRVGSFHQASGQWQPPLAGGTIPSIVSAATTNLGSVAPAAVNITGNQSIASFGATVPEGQIKYLTFTGSATLVYNSIFMILPGAANFTMSPGLQAIALSLGSGRWRVAIPNTGGSGGVVSCGVATAASIGCVKPDTTTLTVAGDGALSVIVPNADLIAGNGSVFSGVTVGAQLLLSAATLSAPLFDDDSNGTVPLSGGGTTNFLRADATWAVPALACTDLTDDGTACRENTGTSGHTLPFLDGNNTWSGTNTFSTVYGSTRVVAGTTDTLSGADCGKTIVFNSGSAVTVTTVANPNPLAACAIAIYQHGAGAVSIANGVGTTSVSSRSCTKTSAQYATLALFVQPANPSEWNIFGDCIP